MKNLLLIFILVSIFSDIKSQNPACFSNPAIYIPNGSATSRGIATGFLNADAIPDIVVTSVSNNSVNVFIGNGDGTFNLTMSMNVSGPARSVTINDFNNDGKMDFAICVSTTNQVFAYMGDGLGSLLLSSSYGMGTNPFGITSADFNGDGNIDVAVANNGTSNFSVRMGDGLGGFGAMQNFSSVGGGGYAIVNGDFNSDGFKDIAVAFAGSNNVQVFSNNGLGAFTSIGTFSTGAPAYGLAVLDFNNDTFLDIVAVCNASSNVTILTGNGSGAFSSSSASSGGSSNNFFVTSGDYNNDNLIDLAITNNVNGMVTFMTGNGAGLFFVSAVHILTNGPAIITTGDFNLDGEADVAFGDLSSNQFGVLLNHTAVITPSGPTSFCPGGNVELNANVSVGFTYSWTPSGSSQDSIVVNSTGNYSLTLTNANGSCNTVASVSVTVFNSPVVTASATPNAVCAGGTVVLTGGGAQTYLWTAGAINGAPHILNTPTTFTVTGTDINSCTNTASVFVPLAVAPPQDVCVVSVDSTTANHNVVIWEKPTTYAEIDSFIVYREITLNNYQPIGKVHRDSLSEFHDYGANPNSTGYRYKMGTLDTCGNISALNLYHNSIHLQYTGSGNFNWNHYVIESTASAISAYNFYRDDLGNGVWNILQIVSGSQNTFTDVSYASFPNARYRVEVIWLAGYSCTSTRGVINTTRSNIKTPSSVGIENVTQLSDAISLQPNPATNTLQITFSKNVLSITKIEMYDALGNLVHESNSMIGNCQTINIEQLKAGVYQIRLVSESATLVKRFIKQ